MSLIVQWLPLEHSGESRFEFFLRHLTAINRNVKLGKVKSKSKKGRVVFCFLFVCGAIGTLTTYLKLDLSIAAIKPWNGWFGFRVLSLVFLIYGMGVWLLPILFFDTRGSDLNMRMSSLQSVLMDIESFKIEN